MPRRAKARPQRRPLHLVDTNIILRFLIGDDPPRAARAKALMEKVESGSESVGITDEVLTEIVWDSRELL